MKKLLTILLFIISLTGMGQSIVNRATQSSTVSDSRLQAFYNLYVPRYPDTTSASIPFNPPFGQGPLGLDSCGAIIFTYDVNNFWVRACSPKRWVRVDGVQALPDGVYSGGDVGYTGTGLDFFETAATYVLNHVILTSPTVSPITLDPSDPTFGRIDLIGLGPTGPVKITGVPAASPQEPSYNPQVFIRRAAVLVQAGATTPVITTSIIYDENLGLPTEWTATSGGTTNFNNTAFPYHLTKYANTTAITTSQYISFAFNDTVNSGPRGSIVGFIRLASTMPDNQNLNIQLYYQGLPVSIVLPFTSYGMFRNVSAQYQPVIFPMPSFGAANIIFDEIRIIPTGSGTFTQFGADFFQFQSGFSPVSAPKYRFGLEDNILIDPRAVDFNNTNFYFNNINKFISVVSTTSDTAFAVRRQSGSDLLRIDGSTGTTYVFQLFGGNPADPSITVAADGTRISNSHFLSFGNLADIKAFQYPLFVRRGYPAININPELNGALALDNDTTGAQNSDSVLLHQFSVRYTSSVTNVSTEKLYVTGSGAIWNKSTPHASANTDSILIKQNGFIKYRTAAELGIGGAANLQAVTTVGHTTTTQIDANGINVVPSTPVAPDWVTALTYVTNGIGWGGEVVIREFGDGTGDYVGIQTLPLTALRTQNLPDQDGTFAMLEDTTSVLATKWYVNSVAGGGGFVGVTNVAGVNANGFSWSIATPTSTPSMTLSTSVTTGQLIYANSGALTGSANLTWVNATSRLGIGATGAAYLSLAPSTTSQASLNLGNAGTAPTSPNNSDVWVSANEIFARLNGVTTQISHQSSTGVLSAIGTANQVNVSGATGNVTFSLPQSIATTSTPTFQRVTLSGAAATANAILTSHTDPAAAAGVLTNNGTRLAFSFATTYKRFALTNDVAPTNGQIPIGNGTDYTVSSISPANNVVVITNGAGSIALGLNMTPQTLTDGATITWNAANGFNATVTLGGTGRTLSRSNWVAGGTYTLKIVQDGTGSRTITTWPAGIRWPSGTAPTLSTTAGAINIVSFYYDGVIVAGAYQSGAYQ